jgi:uncharacterized membrane protein YcaP (DUF421 family)
MFNWDPTTLLLIAVRTAIVYTFLILGLRLTGKRELGQLNPLDLVLILVISNAVQNAMTGPDTSVTGGMVAAITLLIINQILSYFRDRSDKADRFLEGSPTLLVHDGQFVTANLAKENLTEDDVMQALREHGVDKVSDCQTAVLEVDGSISVIIKSDQTRPSNLPLPQQMRRRRIMRHR